VAVEPQLSRLAGQANSYTRTLASLLWTAGRCAELAPAIEKGRGVRLRADMTRNDDAPQGLNERETVRFGELVWQERQLRTELEGVRAALANIRELVERLSAQAESANAPERAALEDALAQVAREEVRLNAERAEKQKSLFAAQAERKALEARDPNFDPPPPDFAQLQELAERSGDAIVYLFPVSQDQGTLWQIVHPGSGNEPGPADQQMAASFTPEGLLALLANDPADKDGVPDAPPGWLWAYLGWLGTLNDDDAGQEMRLAATMTWQTSMDHVLTVLGKELLAPLAERLRAVGARRVVLIPGGQLAFLPLHAAKIDGETTFGDDFEVRYAASATLLKRAHEQLPKTQPAQPQLTAIANPDRSLPFTDGQVRSVADLFPEGMAKLAFGTKARKDWLVEHASDADYLELSTHAGFNFAQPVQSHFQLAYEDGHYKSCLREVVKRNAGSEHRYERLTLGDIWSGTLVLKPGCMVCANACETGLMDLTPDALEEQLGFPTAFLSAGAATVMASFWAVSDFSTWLLMANVYERMLHRGESASSALQQASQDLRAMTCEQVMARLDAELPAIEAIRAEADAAQDDEAYIAANSALGYLQAERKRLARLPRGQRPFAHPYHWAAFGVHGAVRKVPKLESE
jgi:CHAT domain-containing protein